MRDAAEKIVESELQLFRIQLSWRAHFEQRYSLKITEPTVEECLKGEGRFRPVQFRRNQNKLEVLQETLSGCGWLNN